MLNFGNYDVNKGTYLVDFYLFLKWDLTLYSEPHFENFPFDRQTIEILFEDPVYTSAQLVYVPVAEQTRRAGRTGSAWGRA